jgi:hypothetical protein
MRRLRWLGLFALIPLTVLLIVLDDAASLTETWHYVLLGVIVVLVCVLALRWSERNPELMENQGVDALIRYRPLQGTVQAMGADTAARKVSKKAMRRLAVDYDPTAYPPVANNRPDDEETAQ